MLPITVCLTSVYLPYRNTTTHQTICGKMSMNAEKEVLTLALMGNGMCQHLSDLTSASFLQDVFADNTGHICIGKNLLYVSTHCLLIL